MEQISRILSEMDAVVSDPGKAVKKFKAQTGKGAIGCFPVYVPEELIYAAGMLPVGMWGGQTDIVQANTYLQGFACSIMRAIMEFGLEGVYDELSAVIIPAHCDTLKCVGENWKVAVPQVPYIGLVYPQNRKTAAGVSYLQGEFQRIRKQLEEISGEEISDEAIAKSIAVYNEYRQTMREFTRVAAGYPSIITPKVRHLVIKAGFFMDKAKQTSLVRELINSLKQLPKETFKGPKVVLTGILAEPDAFLDLFAEYNIAVVGDDLAQESRQFRTDVPQGSNPIEQLAKRWSDMEGCSLLYDPQKARGEMLIQLVREHGADGIVVCMMKFCDPEEFDYPIYKKELEKAGIPYLYLEIEQQMESVEQLRTRLQGFAEMLNMQKEAAASAKE
jgi:bcr-type benzoyl-CoA reductase subunit C